MTWQFLGGWAQHNQIQFGHPRIEIPTSSVQRKDDKNISIAVSPSDKEDATAVWMVYSITRDYAEYRKNNRDCGDICNEYVMAGK